MTTSRGASDQTSVSGDIETQDQTSDKKARRRKAKPAGVWLSALLAPQKSALRTKAWLDVATGLMAIPQAACLALGIGALLVDKSGLNGLLPYAVGLLLVIFIRSMLAYIAGRRGHTISAKVRHDLRTGLANKLARHSPLDVERRSAGEVAALGSDVIEAFDAYTSRYLSLRLQLTFIPLAVLLAVGWVSWAVAIILMVCGPLVPFFMALIGIRAKKASDEQISALSDMSAQFLDRLSGMTTLRLFRAVGRTRREVDGLATSYRRATMKVLRIVFLSSAALELFSALGIALTAIYVAYHYLGFTEFGSYGMPVTISSGLFLLMLAPEFFAPLREFAVAYHDKATAESAADRLRHVLPEADLSPESHMFEELPASDVNGEFASDLIELISFDHCAFGYSEERGTIVSDVTCQFKRGEKVAILGASGGGKSTLLAALCGFLPAKNGGLAINGDPAPTDPVAWDRLRQSIAWIGQKPHIFHGSLLMNARLARPDASRDDVRDAIALAHADQFVAQLPRDLITILGETGFGISGGQVRRLAIARAVLSRSSVILCDEPTADLDAETAALVTESLVKVADDKLLVVATHDRAVAEACDRILYLQDGLVREITHQDLAAIDAELLAGREDAEEALA